MNIVAKCRAELDKVDNGFVLRFYSPGMIETTVTFHKTMDSVLSTIKESFASVPEEDSHMGWGSTLIPNWENIT